MIQSVWRIWEDQRKTRHFDPARRHSMLDREAEVTLIPTCRQATTPLFFVSCKEHAPAQSFE